MRKKQKHNIKKKIRIKSCSIKKSIKEEKEAIKSKIQYRELFKVDEEATLFEKILYWFFFIVGTLLCIYFFRNGVPHEVFTYILIYMMAILFLGAMFYTCRWKVVKGIYRFVSKPSRIVFTVVFRILKIETSIQYILQCFAALVISSFCSLFLLCKLPDSIPLFKNVITTIFPNPEVASHMCIICFIVVCILVGMLLMYGILRAMLVVFMVGERKSKLIIFEKVWKEMKLLFYLITTILQFWATANDIMGTEGNYLFEAVVLIMLFDQYMEKRKE